MAYKYYVFKTHSIKIAVTWQQASIQFTKEIITKTDKLNLISCITVSNMQAYYEID